MNSNFLVLALRSIWQQMSSSSFLLLPVFFSLSITDPTDLTGCGNLTKRLLRYHGPIPCRHLCKFINILYSIKEYMYMWAKPKNQQFLSPPLSTAVEGGTPGGMMCTTYTISMQLYTFPHKFPQNGSFFLLFFFNPINFDLWKHFKIILEGSE